MRSSHRPFVAIRILLLVASVGAAVPVLSQAPGPAAHRERKTAITLNPFALVATYLAGDIETAVKPMLTLGVGGSYNGVSDFNDYAALEGKVRYYPQETALQGFSIAGTFGVASAKDNGYVVYDATGQPVYGSTTGRTTRATLGTELSYQWLLGPTKRFVAVAGAGVKRLLGSTGFSDPIDSSILPTARVSIGIAF